MKLGTCVHCRRKRGKRYCPALRGPLCAPCCAADRVLEIPCDLECSALLEALPREMEDTLRRVPRLARESPSWAKEALRVFEPMAQGGYETLLAGLDVLVPALAERYWDTRGTVGTLPVTDEVMLEALGSLREMFQAEQAHLTVGVTTQDPRAMGLARDWAKAFDKALQDRELEIDDVLFALDLLKLLILATQRETDAPNAFVRFALRQYPEHTLAAKRQKSGIILTDRG